MVCLNKMYFVCFEFYRKLYSYFSGDSVDCVVLNLSNLHYTHVYRLSIDTCNRELLFALSWLLANDVLVKHVNYHIYKSSLPLYCEFTQPPKDEVIAY